MVSGVKKWVKNQWVKKGHDDHFCEQVFLDTYNSREEVVVHNHEAAEHTAVYIHIQALSFEAEHMDDSPEHFEKSHASHAEPV